MERSFFHGGRLPLLLVLALGMLAGCGQDDASDDETQPVGTPEIARIMPAEEALAGAHVPTLDPATMNDAEIRKAIGADPYCMFRYTSTGKPVLASTMLPDGATGGGVVKLNGSLITLQAAPRDPGGEQAGDLLLLADPVRVMVTPDLGEQAEDHDGVQHWEADMVFEVGQSLRVGYRGYFECRPEPPVTTPPQ